MIKILDINDENIFGLRIEGMFDAEDVQQVLKAVEEKARGKEKIGIYYEIADLDMSGISMKMLEEEFKWLFKNPGIISKLYKVVLVTDSDWLRKAFAIEYTLIPTLTGKSFSFGEEFKAMEWLMTDQRKDSRMDITYSEFVESLVMKSVSGIGLGLLAANLFSKKQRQKIGLAILAGSIVAGLPLGIKVLNNNRKLIGK